MGSTLDPVIRQAPCDIVVVKACENDPEKEVNRILFPLRGRSAHRDLAIEVLRPIAKRYNAEVTILHVMQKHETQSDAKRITESIPEQMQGIPYSTKIVESDDLVDSIVDESKKHDLVVIGATEASMFEQLLFGSVPEEIAKRCSTTVLMVKRRVGIRSRFRRWFS